MLTPLFLVAGTFFPLSNWPEPVQKLAQLNPLYQTVQLVRDAVFGWDGWEDFARAGYLALFAVAVWRVAIFAMERKLID